MDKQHYSIWEIEHNCRIPAKDILAALVTRQLRGRRTEGEWAWVVSRRDLEAWLPSVPRARAA